MLAVVFSECVVRVKMAFHLLLSDHCLFSPVKIIGCEFLLCFTLFYEEDTVSYFQLVQVD